MPVHGALLVESRDGVRYLTLNRPAVRNAVDGQLAAELCGAFQDATAAADLRAVVLGGAGPVFCAGADLAWIARAEVISEAERLRDADLFVRLFRAIDEYPLPVIGRVQGAAYGGGLGLLAVCDAVVAAEDVQFALREVRVGLVPAIIAPLLVRKIGLSQARRYCLTGEPFSAEMAQRIGLVHEVVAADQLDCAVDEILHHLKEAGAQAVRETKALLRALPGLAERDRWMRSRETNARIRDTEEAREGLRAFLAKRPPAWAQASLTPKKPASQSE